MQKIIKEMIKYFDGDVRRINHALKVYSFADIISESENLPPKKRRILLTAAVLHDVGIKKAEEKYDSSAAKYQEQEGPEQAEKILRNFNLDGEFTERVCFLVGNHHSYSKIDGIDFQILVEADFLVNIYEDNMGREKIIKIRDNIFKTASGIELLEDLYL
jgi:HD superfamily phosphodiesterase